MSETDYNYDTHLERLRERVMEAGSENWDDSRAKVTWDEDLLYSGSVVEFTQVTQHEAEDESVDEHLHEDDEDY